MKDIIKTPSAWFPIAMSIAALSLVLGYLVIFGIQEPQADEGAAARVFQLLLAGQLPIIVFFAVKWLPKKPKQATIVIALQIIAIIIALAPVFLLEL